MGPIGRDSQGLSSPLPTMRSRGRTTIATISHHVTAVASGGAVLVTQDELLSVLLPMPPADRGLGAEWRRAIRPQTNPSGRGGELKHPRRRMEPLTSPPERAARIGVVGD